MTLRKIVTLPDPVLKRKAHTVTKFDKELKTLLDDMVETMREAPGVGLAAPQIGLSDRIIVVEYYEREEDEEIEDAPKKVWAVINPEIVKTSEETLMGVEGCLSIPEIFGDVTRASRVIVRAMNEKGEQIEAEGTELLARCMQHEIDHLDGKLFIDYLSVLKRRSAISKWEKLKDDYPGFIRKVALEKKGPEHSEGEL